MKFYPGNTYQVRLINNLGPESSTNPTDRNEYKDPNTTNLHTHGLHISGEAPGDFIFTIVSPQTQKTFIYNVPCNHFSGLFWYHPHHHGSTTLQVGGGAAGALLVEQPNNETYRSYEGMPQWLIEMEELVIIIQRFNLPFLTSIFDDSSIDTLTSFETSATCNNGGSIFYTLNGKYQPTICLITGEYKRLRLVNTDYDSPLTLYLDFPRRVLNDNCHISLIARDGVLLDNGPRNVTHLWFAPASRADVAIICYARDSGSGDPYTIEIVNQNNVVLGYINVTGDIQEQPSTIEEFKLTPFTPNRPNYLENLLNYNGDFQNYTYRWREGNSRPQIITTPYFQVRVAASTINFFGFEGQGEFLTQLEIGSINEWHITKALTSDTTHPFHMHIFPFQVVESGFNATESGQDIPQNWHLAGDYVCYVTCWFYFLLLFSPKLHSHL